MTKFKAIISDFDGTIADKESSISKKVEDAIKKWIQSGRHFIVASGRPHFRLHSKIESIGIKDPIISSGGAYIFDLRTRKTLFSENIMSSDAKGLVNLLVTNNIRFLVEKDGIYYKSHHQITKVRPDVIYKDYKELEFKDIVKCIIYADNIPYNIINQFIENDIIKKFPNLHIVRNIPPGGEIMWDITSIKASKHLAVLEVIKYLNLQVSESVGVGDGDNDFPLLTACGYKVAMGNAPDELKAIADLVVPSYQEDGVAVLIDKLLSSENTS